MPVGANDFAVDWYSYDEMPNDFDLKHFSISRDLENLVPFIKSALQYQPALRIWASAWSPRVWMKYNSHYAGKPSEPDMPPNGLKPDQAAKEGIDQFIQEDRYFKAYALNYFFTSQNPVLCGLGNTKFDDRLGWNLDLLLRLWIKTRARFPLLLQELAKTGAWFGPRKELV